MKKAFRIFFIGADALVIIFVFLAAFTDLFTVNLTLWNSGFRKLIFYTVESNILAALSLAVTLPFKYRRLTTGKRLPYGCVLFTLAGAASTTVTFMTVVFFLGPTMGFGGMYRGNNFLLHLLCPVLTVLSFVFDIYSDKKLRFAHIPVCVIPTAVYAVVYFIMVIVVGKSNGGWDDFYGFNKGGAWYVSGIVIISASYIIGLLLYLAHKLPEKRESSCG